MTHVSFLYIRGNSVRDIASGRMPSFANDFYFPFMMVPWSVSVCHVEYLLETEMAIL